MKSGKILILSLVALTLVLSGCTSKDKDDKDSKAQQDGNYPMTLTHAFGTTVIEREPEKIATISWGNQDVPLALGVVPVGASKANYGVQDESGLLPWTTAKYKELGVDNPVLFDDSDSLDYEAIANTSPDVILAGYSGLTKEEYKLLSKIAPVVPYESNPWQTLWRDQIRIDASGMGKKKEGKQLVKDLEELIKEKIATTPQIAGKSAVFCFFNPSDLGKFYVYLPTDPRAAYLTDLGLKFPQSIDKLAQDNNSFTVELSAENVEILNDVDIIVAYGNADLLVAMQKDKLLGSVPAIKNGSIALFEDGSTLSASATPSALSIPATIDDYLKIIAEAADKVQ